MPANFVKYGIICVFTMDIAAKTKKFNAYNFHFICFSMIITSRLSMSMIKKNMHRLSYKNKFVYNVGKHQEVFSYVRYDTNKGNIS